MISRIAAAMDPNLKVVNALEAAIQRCSVDQDVANQVAEYGMGDVIELSKSVVDTLRNQKSTIRKLSAEKWDGVCVNVEEQMSKLDKITKEADTMEKLVRGWQRKTKAAGKLAVAKEMYPFTKLVPQFKTAGVPTGRSKIAADAL